MFAGLIQRAAEHLGNGDRVSARLLLEEVLRLNPGNEQGWLWMSGAVETDSERLACLRQVLVINPENQAAMEGIQALSQPANAGKIDSREASLENFLKEQETRQSIHPKPAARKAARPALSSVKASAPGSLRRKTDWASAVKPSDLNLSEFRNAGEDRGMDWSRPGLSLALPLSRERTFGLPGLLKEVTSRKKQRVKKQKIDLIPLKELPFNSTQVTYFVLGLIITFLLMLIGFSALKTLVEGPRYKARAPAAAPLLPTPTPLPEPAPLAFNPTFVPSDCRFSVPQEAHVECFTMILPETRDGTSARSIRLPLVIYKSLNPFPPPDPIVTLYGRGSAIDWAAENYENFVLPLLYQRDVIVVELRGSGQSTPNLDCPELNNQYLFDFKENPSDAGRTRSFVSAAQACRDRLASQGIRFRNFTTRASSADIADITVLLDYDQVNLYGISYGGSVAQSVLQEHPSIVRSVVLDSALPLEDRAYNSIARSTDTALLQLFEACEANSTCRSAYPNLQGVFNEVKTKLDESPLSVPSTSPGSASGVKMIIDGTRFQQAVFQALFSNVFIPGIPKGVYAARYGETAFLEEALSSPRLHVFDPALGGMLPQNCLEQVYATSPAELEAGLETYPTTSIYIRYSLFGSASSLFEICELWTPPLAENENKAPLASSIPALIFTGQLDPVAPVYLQEQLAARLDKSTLVVFPALGHSPSTARGQDCPLSLAAVFINDPFANLDPSCGMESNIQFTLR